MLRTQGEEDRQDDDIQFPAYYDYKAFGFSIRSCIACPELTPYYCPAPDVSIRYGRVPDTLESPLRKGVCFQAVPGIFLLILKKIARYMVSEGKEIVIERINGSEDTDLRLFLLGSVMGALLYQRGFLPLHASAIKTAQGTGVLFAGNSGVGKSTLAAAFQKRGYPVLSDDISAISTPNGSRPILHPGFPELKLWPDAAKKLDESPEELPRARRRTEKRSLQFHGAFDNAPSPIKHIYIMQAANKPDFELIRLRGTEKIEELLNYTYRMAFLGDFGKEAVHFKCCASLGAHAEISRVIRPMEDFRLDELADLLEKDFA